MLQKLITFFLNVFVVLAFAHCNSDCHPFEGTMVEKCVSYKGEPNAIDPYAEQGEVTTTSRSVLARLWLHNPTETTATVDATCEFWLNDWNAGNNSIHNVKVCPSSSRRALLQWIFYI